MLTNLRIRWSCTGSPAMNVNIGLGTVTSMSTRTASSRVRGDTGAIVIATKDPEQPLQRLEFIFGCRGSVATPAGAQSQAANPAGSPSSASAGLPDGLASGTPGARWVAATHAVLKSYETTRLYRCVRAYPRGMLQAPCSDALMQPCPFAEIFACVARWSATSKRYCCLESGWWGWGSTTES